MSFCVSFTERFLEDKTGSDNQVYVNIYLSYKDNDTLCLDYKIQPKDYANNAAYIILHYYPEYDICHFNCDVEGAWIEVLEMGVLTTKEILDYGINLTFIKEDSR